ncbi:unnamed protein product [Brassica rapa subsp. narinosa]
MRDSKYLFCAEKSYLMDFLKILEKELRIMLRFRNHPCIVQITSPNLHVGINELKHFLHPNLHVGINLDRCYINMEFASKGSLHNVISSSLADPCQR